MRLWLLWLWLLLLGLLGLLLGLADGSKKVVVVRGVLEKERLWGRALLRCIVLCIRQALRSLLTRHNIFGNSLTFALCFLWCRLTDSTRSLLSILFTRRHFFLVLLLVLLFFFFLLLGKNSSLRKRVKRDILVRWGFSRLWHTRSVAGRALRVLGLCWCRLLLRLRHRSTRSLCRRLRGRKRRRQARKEVCVALFLEVEHGSCWRPLRKSKSHE